MKSAVGWASRGARIPGAISNAASNVWMAVRDRAGSGIGPARLIAGIVRPSDGGPDRVLCGAVLMLAALGTVMVFSAGAVFAGKRYGDPF